MLRYFRLNDPYQLIAVLLVLVGLSLPIFLGNHSMTITELKDLVVGKSLNNKMMYVQLIDDTPWLGAWFDKWIFFVFENSQFARHLLALFIFFFQSVFFSRMLIHHRAYDEDNYLSALIFGLISFFSFDLRSLSHELLASTFLLFALSNLFKEIEYKEQQQKETVFNVGLHIGLASLFVVSFSVFLIGSFLLLLLYARLSLRKSLLLVFGFGFPHVSLIILYFFLNKLPHFFNYFYVQNFFSHSVNYVSVNSVLILGSIILLYLFFALVILNREAHFTKHQSQLFQVMLIWLLFAFIEAWLTKKFSPHSFIPMIPPIAYLISHYFLLIRRRWIAEIMFLAFCVSTITLGTLSRLNKIPLVDYSKLVAPQNADNSIQGKKIMVLGNGWNVYAVNTPSTYFLNWDLSEEYFDQADVYQHLILISECFEQEKPDVIIDENGLMENVFKYNPALKQHYKKNQKTYWREPN